MTQFTYGNNNVVNIGSNGVSLIRTAGSSPATFIAYDDTSALPEPGVVALLALWFASLAGIGRRRVSQTSL